MSKNMWNLQNIDRGIKDSPNEILREQAAYFEKATKEILYARIDNIKLKKEVKEYTKYALQTDFNIVCPTLDNYTYVVCSIFSNPESSYPLAITKNCSKEELEYNFEPDYTCNNEEEFAAALEGILSSEDTTNVVMNLYSKSKTF